MQSLIWKKIYSGDSETRMNFNLGGSHRGHGITFIALTKDSPWLHCRIIRWPQGEGKWAGEETSSISPYLRIGSICLVSVGMSRQERMASVVASKVSHPSAGHSDNEIRTNGEVFRIFRPSCQNILITLYQWLIELFHWKRKKCINDSRRL